MYTDICKRCRALFVYFDPYLPNVAVNIIPMTSNAYLVDQNDRDFTKAWEKKEEEKEERKRW